MEYTAVINCLKAANLPVRQVMGAEGGCAAVTTLGGRVAALRVEGVPDNIFHTNADVSNRKQLKKVRGNLPFGIGGLRLWFAPEFAFNWKGKPDARRFTTYTVQHAYDPARYIFCDTTHNAVRLNMSAKLEDWRDDSRISFSVERIVAYTPSPVSLRGLRYMGIRLQHRIELHHAQPHKRMDLWQILQMPAASRLLVPTQGKPKPLIYFNAFHNRDWRLSKNALLWDYRGTAKAKIGLDIAQITGFAGVLRPLSEGNYAAVIWKYPMAPGMIYVDGPREAQAKDQIIQAWDGFGYGELEVHSPSVSLHDPVYAEHSFLWCFVGSLDCINRVAQELLQRKWL